MAIIADLTLQQWADQLPPGSITIVAGKAMLDLGLVSGLQMDAMTDMGVVKAITKMLEGGYQAQVTVNQPQPTGERLAAFGIPGSGAAVNGYAPTSRLFTSRSELASATNVVGQTA